MNISDNKSKPLRIIFALPGRSFTNNFLIAWSELLTWCYRNNIIPILSNRYTSNVYYVRNMCLGGDVNRGIYQKPYNGKINYDYIMWIDSDIVFKVTDFINLLKQKKDIVSGLYLMQGGTSYATVINWDSQFFKKNGHFDFLNIIKHKELQKNNNIITVSYTGLGFMLVKYGVFESIEYPWFRPTWEEFGNNIKDFSSEDVGWCKTILKKGYKIHIDLNTVVGHEKSIVLHPSIYEKPLVLSQSNITDNITDNIVKEIPKEYVELDDECKEEEIKVKKSNKDLLKDKINKLSKERKNKH